MNENIKDIVEKYRITKDDKQEKFDRYTPLIPRHLFDKFNVEADKLNQLTLSTGILVSHFVNNYLKFLEESYEIDSLLLEENVYRFVKEQMAITTIPETTDKIDKIKRITGERDGSAVVRKAMEFGLTIMQ